MGHRFQLFRRSTSFKELESLRGRRWLQDGFQHPKSSVASRFARSTREAGFNYSLQERHLRGHRLGGDKHRRPRASVRHASKHEDNKVFDTGARDELCGVLFYVVSINLIRGAYDDLHFPDRLRGRPLAPL